MYSQTVSINTPNHVYLYHSYSIKGVISYVMHQRPSIVAWWDKNTLSTGTQNFPSFFCSSFIFWSRQC